MYIQVVKKVADDFDPDDFPFIALALKLNAPIWTNDKKLIVHGLKSGAYLAMDTHAVEKLIQGKSLEEIRQELNERYLRG